jgi:hypothetical protein
VKVINKNGEVLPVDDSALEGSEKYYPCVQQVTLIDDEVYLKPMWIVTGEFDKQRYMGGRAEELEFVTEEVYDHEPSETELIYFMAKNGLGLFDYCHVQKAFKMERNYED